VAGGPVGQQVQYMSLPMNRDLKYCKKSVATRKYQSLVHTCRGKMEGKYAKDISANECGFRSL